MLPVTSRDFPRSSISHHVSYVPLQFEFVQFGAIMHDAYACLNLTVNI